MKMPKWIDSGSNRTLRLVWLTGLGFLALIVRILLFPYASLDFQTSFSPLYEFIASNPAGYVLANDPSSYTPIHTYFMLIASRLFRSLPSLIVIKLIPTFFDFICAVLVYRLVKLIYPNDRNEFPLIPILGYVAVLFSPTIIMNSAFWGQVDIVYASGMLACIYFLIIKKEVPAFIAFGFAVSFKLQAIFLFPLLLVLLVKKYVHWKSFLLIPLMYLLSILPSWLGGRSGATLFSVYLSQSHVFNRLSMNAPNLYQWISDQYYEIFYPAGIALTLGAIAVVVLIGNNKMDVGKRTIMLTALVSCVLIPFILPKMHDRYFFPADIISIVYAFYNPRYYYVPIAIGMISFFSYGPALFGSAQIPLQFLAIGMGIILVILIREYLVTSIPHDTIPVDGINI